MNNKLSELKAAALAATPGPWFRSGVQFNGITTEQSFITQGNKPHVASASEKRDAIFIAAANPAVVIALLAELEAKDKRNAFLKEQLAKLANFNPDWDMLEACRESWREVAAALKEAESKLATPIKIVNYDEFFICHVSGASDDYCKGWVDGRNAAARDVGKAGFTVEGDE